MLEYAAHGIGSVVVRTHVGGECDLYPLEKQGPGQICLERRKLDGSVRGSLMAFAHIARTKVSARAGATFVFLLLS